MKEPLSLRGLNLGADVEAVDVKGTPVGGWKRLRVKQCGLTGRGLGAWGPPRHGQQGTPGCQAEWAPALHRASPGEVLKQD